MTHKKPSCVSQPIGACRNIPRQSLRHKKVSASGFPRHPLLSYFYVIEITTQRTPHATRTRNIINSEHILIYDSIPYTTTLVTFETRQQRVYRAPGRSFRKIVILTSQLHYFMLLCRTESRYKRQLGSNSLLFTAFKNCLARLSRL